MIYSYIVTNASGKFERNSCAKTGSKLNYKICDKPPNNQTLRTKTLIKR